MCQFAGESARHRTHLGSPLSCTAPCILRTFRKALRQASCGVITSGTEDQGQGQGQGQGQVPSDGMANKCAQPCHIAAALACMLSMHATSCVVRQTVRACASLVAVDVDNAAE